MRNCYISGLPGAGKTTIGRAVAKRLGYSFVESVEDILAGEAQTLTALWEKEGEAGIRFRERVALLRLAHADGLVVALTDGALIWENNRVTMNKTGLTFALLRDVEKIDLVDRDQPTLPQGEASLPELLEDREELYGAYATLVDNNGDPDAAVEAIVEAMEKENDRFRVDWLHL